MKKLTLFLILLTLALPVGVEAVEVRGPDETRPGFGTDTRAAYGGLASNTGITVTCVNGTGKITGTGVATDLAVGNCFELTDSASNDDQVFMITTYTSANDVTVTPAPTDEGPTASVDIAQIPTICVVDSLTYNDAIGNDTRNGIPVKTGGFQTLCDFDVTNKAIVFEVSGTIPGTGSSQTEYITDNRYVSILGQTAPSPGILLKDAKLLIRTRDVLVQHLRVRGVYGTVGDAAISVGTSSGGGGYSDVQDVVIDHCSASWAYEANILVSNYYPVDYSGTVENITISNCIAAEGLTLASNDGKGFQAAQYTENVSSIGNLYVSNTYRAPYLRTKSFVGVNNLVYNPGDGEHRQINNDLHTGIFSFKGNRVHAGPYSSTTAQRVTDMKDIYAGGVGTQAYLEDNVCEQDYSNPGSYFTQADSSDWFTTTDFVRDRPAYPDYWDVSGFKQLTAPLWPTGLTALASADVEASVLANAGARPADRDSVDARFVSEVQSGGTLGVSTAITSVPGWPTLDENTRNVGTGMAVDGYLNIPSDPHADNDDDGYTADNTYTNLEEWLHDLAEGVESGPPPPSGSCGFTGNYDGAWSGEYLDDTDEMCIDSGASSMDAATISGATIGTDYDKDGDYGVLLDADGEYVSYTITNKDIFDTAQGTLWFDIYPVASGSDSNYVFCTQVDAQNYLLVQFYADNTAIVKYEGQDTRTTNISTDLLEDDAAYNLVGVRWDQSENKLGLKINSGDWKEHSSNAMTAWTGEPGTINLGACGISGGTIPDSYWLDNVTIYTTYDATRAEYTGSDTGPDFSTATWTAPAETYSTVGNTITITCVTNVEAYVGGPTPYRELETGVDDAKAYYSYKDGTTSYWVATLEAGMRSLDLTFKGTTITLPSGCTIESMLGETATTTGLATAITNETVVAVLKDANNPWEVKPAGGDATTILALEALLGSSGLLNKDFVVVQSSENYIATAAGVLFRVLSIGNFDCDNLAITIYGTNRISGTLSNSGSATLYPYNPPMISN